MLLEGPIAATLLRLSVPNLLLMLVQSSVGLIEAYWIGKLGTDALAGVALVFPALMLMQMMSGGAVGGGISSAIARALGGGRRAEADALVVHALAIAAVFGIVFSAAVIAGGAQLYTLMGGGGATLSAAIAYSDPVFAAVVLLWLFNALASVLRGTGNMALPALVTTAGMLILLPLSPALIFGWGPFPRLGIAGGGVAVFLFYLFGAAILFRAVWSGRNVVRPSFRAVHFNARLFHEILRVGLVASVITVTTNLTVACTNAIIGAAGTDTLAGYGIGNRLEYLLIPLTFGLGGPLVAMVGTCVGAGAHQRAFRAAWLGAAIAGLLAEAIGLAAAFFPQAWLSLFTADPGVIEAGSRYLRAVGPFYGFFGFGMALYFASQGAGRLGWALIAGTVRLLVAVAGAWLAWRWTGNLTWVFLALGVALLAMGAINAIGAASGVFGVTWRGLRTDRAMVYRKR